jgi:S-adenosylmethionine hydrolase
MPVVTFLSDYGVAGDFVGARHGVGLRIRPLT